MKLSERIKQEHRSWGVGLDGSRKITSDEVAQIEELEHKAALWDKVSSAPLSTQIERNATNNWHVVWELDEFASNGDTLEEALNQIPEYKV